MLEDIGRTIGKLARRLDDTFERILRRVTFRKRRTAPTNHAGFVSRALAYVIDGIFVNLGFTALVALVTLADNAFGGTASGGSSFAIAVGSTAWVAMGSLYLVGFWALAGQTPGMRFVGIRISVGRLAPRRALRRLVGLYLSVFTLGIGFLGIVFREPRRGWEDRFCGADVIYDERRPEPAPWSSPATVAAPAVAVPPEAALVTEVPVPVAVTEPEAAAVPARSPAPATAVEPVEAAEAGSAPSVIR
ncbi:MAG: RDD family protein [Solirubrobacterales bacterium]|nr:RDD family protein [Solirubrobacterales bacterium]